MSLDVSPDGRTLVFDLLGHLYLLPVNGGRARALTSGESWDKQPRFSLDGRYIAYISDKSGFDDLWLVDRDGASPRQVSNVRRGAFANTSINSPAWTPDGASIVVAQRRGAGEPMTATDHSQRWLLAKYEIATGDWRWISDTSLAGARGALGPDVAPDGQAIYAAVEPAGWSGQERAWRVARISVADGCTTPELPPWQGRLAMRPAVSPKGQFLTYVTPNGAELGLRIRDLQTSDERWLLGRGLDWGAWAGRGMRGMHSDLAPGYGFTPDGESVVIAYGGKIHRIDIRSGASEVIPFVATVERDLAPVTLHQFSLPDTAVRTRAVDQAALSPDGRRVAFSFLRRIWIMDLPSPTRAPAGRPRRLTADTVGEFYPSWSPDGSWIAYSTWEDGLGGTVRRAWVDDRTRGSEPVSSDTALYFHTAVTQDGRQVVAARSELPNGGVIAYTWPTMPAVRLVRLALERGSRSPPTVISDEIGPAFYSHEGKAFETTRYPVEQLYLAGAPEEIQVGLVSWGTDGRSRREIAPIVDPTYPSRLAADVAGVLSPDRRRALVTDSGELSEIWLPTDTPQPQDTFDVGQAYKRPFGSAKGAARRWGPALSPWISWSRDGRRVLFVQGGTFFVGDVPERGWTAFTRIDVPLKVPVDRPEGSIVLRGARAITMQGESERKASQPVVLEQADIVVRGNRIAGIGPTGTVAIPPGATVWNVAGKTILPRYVDVHDHQGAPAGIRPQQWWGWLVRLSHGVTTIRDPSEFSGTYNSIFAYRELERAGLLVGPRLFSTGMAHYGLTHPDTISVEEARAVATAYADYLDSETFKEYTGRLDTEGRRRMAAAATAAGLNATIHWEFPLQAVAEGFSSIEHGLQMVAYDDVLTFIARSGVTWTETFNVTAIGEAAQLDFGTEPWKCPLMYRFVPPGTRARQTSQWLDGIRALAGRPGPSYLLPRFRSAAGAVQRGGRVAVGSHGEIPGLGTHYELWSYVRGGMWPFAALRAATIEGARAIGHAKDFGSLEVGKFADLQVLDKSPLADIENTTSVRYVMKNGRLYQASDLTEVWPRHAPLSPIYLFHADSVSGPVH